MRFEPYTPKEESEKEVKAIEVSATGVGVFFLIILIWLLIGLVAFITSIVCFGRGGSSSEKTIGLLIAMFFGPFYWIYFFVSKTYCTSQPSMMGGKRK
jgi:small-conductance mechanosensitive channel